MTLSTEPINTLHGEPTSLDAFAGKTILAVNVASKCGLTPQYTGLEALQATYASKGFTVVGFPCNQFGGQEPGTEGEIKTFCETKFGVSFPLFGKLDVNGPNRHPLYGFLTGEATAPDASGDIKWNFAKFLIDRQGKGVARVAPTTAPVSVEIVGALEQQRG